MVVVMELVVVFAADVGNIIYGSGGGIDKGGVLLLAEFAGVAVVAVVVVVLVVAVVLVVVVVVKGYVGVGGK